VRSGWARIGFDVLFLVAKYSTSLLSRERQE
jgi:hypothetical protein